MSEPRKHHFVPAFYLAGFASEASSTGRLVALSKPQLRWFEGTPRTLGFQRDLYRVDHPDLDPNAIENAFAEVEGAVAPALRRLVDDSIEVDPVDVARVLNLVAMLLTRVPVVRRWMARAIENLATKLTDFSFQRPDMYEGFLAKQRAEGKDPAGLPSFEEMKRAWERGAFKPKAENTFLTLSGLRLAAELYDVLAYRSWTVMTVDLAVSGPIVTSDRPVSLYWTRPDVPPFGGPGLGLKDTEVLFPLDLGHVLVGQWGEREPRRMLKREGVAMANGQTLLGADRHVYSVSEEFVVMDQDGQAVTPTQFLDRHRDSGQRVDEGE